MPPADTFSHLQALGGELKGTISANSTEGVGLTLTYSAHVPLVPFTFNGTLQNTAIQLFTLPLAVRSWRALAHRTYQFPDHAPHHVMVDGEAMPAGDYAPGAMHLLGQYLPLCGTHLAFGAIEARGITTTLTLSLNLEKINYPPAQLTLLTTLQLGGVRVVGDVTLIKKPDLTESAALAAPWLDLADYTPQVVNGIVTYCPLI